LLSKINASISQTKVAKPLKSVIISILLCKDFSRFLTIFEDYLLDELKGTVAREV